MELPVHGVAPLDQSENRRLDRRGTRVSACGDRTACERRLGVAGDRRRTSSFRGGRRRNGRAGAASPRGMVRSTYGGCAASARESGRAARRACKARRLISRCAQLVGVRPAHGWLAAGRVDLPKNALLRRPWLAGGTAWRKLHDRTSRVASKTSAGFG